MENLKKELLNEIMACNDEEVLKKVQQILQTSTSEVSEAGEEYAHKDAEFSSLSESHLSAGNDLTLSSEQEEGLMKRVVDHSRGIGRTFTWDEVKENIKKS